MPYLVDSYALLAWFMEGNPGYKHYFSDIENGMGYTTHLSLLEFYFFIYHRLGEREADARMSEILPYLDVVPLSVDLLKAAAKFRSQMLPKKKFSYTDSVNYVAAQNNKLKLLTGDEEFRGMRDVEFVK